MAIQDGFFNFARQQSLSGTSDTVSTNVYNAGSAIKLFCGAGEPMKLAVQVTAAGGTSPTFRARLVAADNAALTTNPIIIVDTGVSAVLTAADLPVLYELLVGLQVTAKQYYGVIFLQSGTSPTATANAFLAHGVASNLLK
jgi:hypothetical protein